jgi:5'-deoxynucleotidase YfbR-like HD superfamily hydrolase
MNLPSALESLIRHLKTPVSKMLPQEKDDAEELSRRWFSDPEAREEVSALLREIGLDESAVEAEAIRISFDVLDALDGMLTSLEGRRNKALACLVGYRASLMPQPRGRADRILEARPARPLRNASNENSAP